jgi:hypothetical protein
MKNLITFQKTVSYASVLAFALITIIFLSSYIPMKVKKGNERKLFFNAVLLAYEKGDVNEYPYDLNCFIYNRFDVENTLIDSWGNPFFYERIDNGQDYILFSKGKDGIPFTDDDIHTVKPRWSQDD